MRLFGMVNDLLLLLQLFLLITVTRSYSYCPQKCNCAKGTVFCNDLDLTEIPKGIPVNTARLELQNNRISRIRRYDFANLTQLKALHLSNNDIQHIEEHAFDSLHKLERIRLNKNRIRTLPDAIFAYNQQLLRIDLSENYLSVLTDKQLQGPKLINNLQINNNFLTCLDTEIISSWTQLEILALNRNNLSSLNELSELKKLRSLRLADNMWLCDCRLRWMQKLLNESAEKKDFKLDTPKCQKPVHLHMKRISNVKQKDLKCSGIEKRAAKTCRQMSVCPPMCICTDSVVDCKDRGLAHIPPNLPASAKEIRLGGNQITFVPSRIFQNHHLLHNLDLSSNNIVEIAPDAFQGLWQLKELILYKNNISEIHPDTFRGLNNLTTLLLNSNKLHCIWKETFTNLTNLSLLSLFQNNIKSIAAGTFDGLKNLNIIHLGTNPWICDCNLEWLLNLLSERPMEASGAVCSSPKEVAGQALLSANSQSKRSFECKGLQKLVTARAGECVIDYGCPKGCKCKDTIIDCSSAGLIHFPSEIPSFTTELRLPNNKITMIKMINKHNQLNKLEKLNLRKNRIKTLAYEAFKNLQNLKEIDLSGNQIKFFGIIHLGNTAPFVQKLVLSNNLLECVKSSSFANFTSLKYLDLSHNHIKCITEGTFSQLTSLRSLYIAHNDFVCDCHIVDFANYLSNNQTKIKDKPVCAEPRTLRDRPIATLRKAQLFCKANEESVCADNGNYCPVNCRCQDTEVKCERRGLKEFPNGIPSDTTYLSLAHNQISIIPKQELNRLHSLTKLDLSDNSIAVVESGTFSNLTHLGMLLLNENNIQCLEDRAFAGLRNLKVLSLYENDISMLPQSAFQDLKSLTMIVMLNNSLYCDCNMAWFSKWLNTNYLDWNELRCDLPLNMRNQKLLTAQTYQFTCKDQVPQSILAKCNPCLEAPCKNGGTCISGRGRAFTCECRVGFHGEKCEDEIDACYGQPCLNSGTCKGLQYGRFQCYCLKGFSGERCEVNIDDCVEHKCKNGGVCLDKINGYECKCPSIYGGQFCERKLEYCTDELNPCKNGGKCSKDNDTYKCTCPAGFTDQNCTTNINDCQNHTCQNNGICIDGVNSFICKCSDGYSGKFCELAPIAHYLYQKISPCDSDICGHGTCNNRGDNLICKCKEGYQGERCDRLRAVGFVDSDAFVELEPWDTDPAGNLTITLRTYAKTGIIAYYGVVSYFSVELFDGRVKTAFFAGNERPSHMYSYTIVSDNMPHKIQFIINGNALTMRIDDWTPQRVENTGIRKNFVVEKKSGLYLGGVPAEMAESVMSKFHVRSTESFKGCISDVYVNDQFINLEKAQRLVNVQRGCAKAVSLCYGVKCENGGECVVNDMRERGYECKCRGNYKGEFCEQRKVHCGKKRFVDYYTKGSCRSLRKVKQGKCVGWCGDDVQCCKAVKVKPKRLRFRCAHSSSIISKRVNIVRKCECSFASKCTN